MSWFRQIWNRLFGSNGQHEADFNATRVALERASAREREDDAARAGLSDRQGR